MGIAVFFPVAAGWRKYDEPTEIMMIRKAKTHLAAKALLSVLLLIAAVTSRAEEPNLAERWPWYGEWEQARFSALSPLVQTLLKRDEAEAIRLIEDGAKLDELVSEHEIRRMAEPRVKIAYLDGEPKAEYPLVMLATVADLPDVVVAIGERMPAALTANDPKGSNALTWAALAGRAEVAKVLLEHGLDPLQVDNENYTPLSVAVYRKKADVVRLLIAAIPPERYGQVKVAERVWVASYLSDTDTLRVLLEAGVPPNYIAPQGNTALISAVLDVSLERVQLLLNHGATADGHRYRGRSIFELAEANLSRGTEDAKDIHRLIQAAPHTVSDWKKPSDVQQMETFLKMIEGKKL